MRDLMRRLSGASSQSSDHPPQDGPLTRRASGGSVGATRPEDTPDALMAEIKYAEARRFAAEGKWGSNLDTLNKVLVLQRKALGQDHPDAGRTLNDIGVALMNLGRYFPAQTALKEAQYIREEALGCGAPEVAETLTNLAILMDKVNAAEDEAHEREEKREVVRRKSAGSLADIGIDADAIADMAKYDSSASDFAGYDDSDTEDDDSDRDDDDDEKRQIMDELQRLEERREQMRLMSMQMAADRKRMSMENISQQQRQQQAKRRGSGSALGNFGAAVAKSKAAAAANMSREELEKEMFSGGARRRKAGGSLGALSGHLSGLNAMDAAKAVSAASRGEDVGMALRRKSGGSISGLSVDAAKAAGFFDSDDDDESDDEDDYEPQPQPRMRRRPSFGPLGGGFGGGVRSSAPPAPSPRGERQSQSLPRPRSFDHLSMGAAIAGEVDLRKKIRDDCKPKKRLSGGILSSAISAFADEVHGDSSDSEDGGGRRGSGPRTYKELSMSKGPSVDLREQIRQEHDRPVRRFSNGLLSKYNEYQNNSGDNMDYVSDQLREKMVFSGT